MRCFQNKLGFESYFCRFLLSTVREGGSVQDGAGSGSSLGGREGTGCILRFHPVPKFVRGRSVASLELRPACCVGSKAVCLAGWRRSPQAGSVGAPGRCGGFCVQMHRLTALSSSPPCICGLLLANLL